MGARFSDGLTERRCVGGVAPVEHLVATRELVERAALVTLLHLYVSDQVGDVEDKAAGVADQLRVAT